MNRKRIWQTAAYVTAIAFILFLTCTLNDLHLTARAAHEASERSAHYGPSEVVHVQKFQGGTYFLGKYDRWISCNTVNRALLLFWQPGSQPTGLENDTAKSIAFTIQGRGIENTEGDSYHITLYGIANDPRIASVKILTNDGRTLFQSELYDGMFLFEYDDSPGSSGSGNQWVSSVQGYDSEGNLIVSTVDMN